MACWGSRDAENVFFKAVRTRVFSYMGGKAEMSHHSPSFRPRVFKEGKIFHFLVKWKKLEHTGCKAGWPEHVGSGLMTVGPSYKVLLIVMICGFSRGKPAQSVHFALEICWRICLRELYAGIPQTHLGFGSRTFGNSLWPWPIFFSVQALLFTCRWCYGAHILVIKAFRKRVQQSDVDAEFGRQRSRLTELKRG